MSEDKIKVGLGGVPETMLWPLWNRAAEMRRKDRLIEDPMSADLAKRIDYDFKRSFGRPSAFHPIRARVCDDLIRDYIDRSDHPVVVGLGEGLETQFWRIGDDRVRWVSVDLPEAIDVRQSLLPAHDRLENLSYSALDPAWMDALSGVQSPFITASGLLMYFEEADIVDLLDRIAERFPGAELFFDTIPVFFSKRTMKGARITKDYEAPPMPWGISVDDLKSFVSSRPGWDVVSVQNYAEPFPHRLRPYNWLGKVGPIRRAFAGGLAHARAAASV